MTDKNEQLEWDAESQVGKDVPEQELPEYRPEAFDTVMDEVKE